jgi:hypothetical protein
MGFSNVDLQNFFVNCCLESSIDGMAFGSSSQNKQVRIKNANSMSFFAGSQEISASVATSFSTFSWRRVDNVVSLWANNTNIGGGSDGNNLALDTVNDFAFGPNGCLGRRGEMSIWTSGLSDTQINTLHREQGSHYGLIGINL